MTFTLDEKQVIRYKAWVEELKPPNPFDEDCCGSSYFEFRFRPSGIGDTVTVIYGITGASLDLTLDDDGEFIRQGEL